MEAICWNDISSKRLECTSNVTNEFDTGTQVCVKTT